LYVRFGQCSAWMYAAAGLPVTRHTSVHVSAGGSGKRLSMAFAPPCSASRSRRSRSGPRPCRS
jgi:hypothetical protein